MFKEKGVKVQGRGFTLIEMFVVLSMFSIILGIVHMALRTNDVYNAIIRIQVELYRYNQRVINEISNELKESKSNSPQRYTIQNGAGVNASDIIYFQVPIGFDINYNPLWGADGTAGNYIRYRLEAAGGSLVREILDPTLKPIGTARLRAHRIIDLQFVDSALDAAVPAGCIRITTSAQKQTPDRHDITTSSNVLVFLEN